MVDAVTAFATLWRWQGAPVRFHWSVLLMLPWHGLYTGSWAGALMGTFAFMLLMVAHELGHAVIARWRGLAVHEIEVLFLHGRCMYEAPDREADHIWVAWGGVLGQGVLLVFALLVLQPLLAVAAPLSPMFAVLIDMNAAVAVLNLLPLAPFDGHIAWRILRRPVAKVRSRVRRASWRARRGVGAVKSSGKTDAAAAASDLIRRAMQRSNRD